MVSGRYSRRQANKQIQICDVKADPKASEGQATKQAEMVGQAEITIIQTGIKARNIRQVNQALRSVTYKRGKQIALQCSEHTQSL